ncbi:hypothetical protein [Halovivax sp.]|uniref:hypothetical protein n=1 Tax=Halovivax sp. TaxID=1935978 RepID=UPI0025C53901|nr:hypothetical protein [Halovivax sp.]
MAPAIVHFLVGASICLLVAAPFARRYDLGWQWPLWLVAIGGIWGLVPDVHHVAPVSETRLRAFHDSRWAELFAFHYTLDRPAVRARPIESTFASIACFLVAVGAFSFVGGAGDGGSTTRDREPVTPILAVGTVSLFLGLGLGGLLYATLA